MTTTEEELSIALGLERFWLCYLDTLVLIQTLLFPPLTYLILFKSSEMRVYRWCLLTNVVSIYALTVAVFLYKPYVLAKGYYFVPLGIVRKLGAKGHFYAIVGGAFLAACHGLAISACLLYQTVKSPASWMASLAHMVDKFLFSSKRRLFGSCFAAAFGVWLLVAAFFMQANVDLNPLKSLSPGEESLGRKNHTYGL